MVNIKERTLHNILADAYANEINCGMSCFWDAGWEVWIGDDMNGYKAKETVTDVTDAAHWLHTNIIKFYPDSAYARQN